MTTHIHFTSKAGGQLEGAIAEPTGAAKVGGLVVVQEWWGVSDHIESICDLLAQQGFLALAPDLYHGKRPPNQEQAAQMMEALDKRKAVSEVGDAAAFLKSHARSNGNVGVIGFCLGGGLALAAARYVEGLAAVVPFYGLPNIPIDEFAKVSRVPIQAHFAQKDNWAKASAAEEIQKKVRSGGGQMDLHVYDAGHAFMRSSDPQAYDAASAKVAWARTMDFLEKHLAAGQLAR